MVHRRSPPQPVRVHGLRQGFPALAVLALAGCGLMPETPTIGLMNHGQPETAVAHLGPASGSQVRGDVRFSSHADDTLVEVNLAHLTPGLHGIHVHEKGDCSDPEALSAGGHYNPDGQPHGAPNGPRHEGDLGNITAAADGTVNLNFHVKGLPLVGDKGIIGRAVVVHAAADDLATQPSGNSGKRVACGVIAHD